MILLPFDFDRVNDDCVLVVNVAGESAFLTSLDFEKLHNGDVDELDGDILNELLAKHFVSNNADAQLDIDLLANKLRSRKSYLDEFTSLHMVVLTIRCNCMCSYCQASSKGGSDDSTYDMDSETARATVDMIFQSPSSSIKIEFQGGEPTLNFDVLKEIVEYAEELNKTKKKDLSFVVCTNLLSISENQLDYFKKHNVLISTSCDGTKPFHDVCRKSLVSDSAYDSFRESLAKVRDCFGQDEPSALLTVTKYNLHHLKEIIDHYISLGFCNLFIRALNPYGYAEDNKMELAYPIDEFIAAYSDALSYIIDLNIHGTYFVESYATLLLQRILTPFPTGFVDLQSPSGAGILGAIYYYNGDVYPADEGRMLAETGDNRFFMGNVKKHSYREIFDGTLIHELVQNSCVECMPACETCAYKSFCGADPIRYYVECKDIVGKRYASNFCKKNKTIVKLLMNYIRENNPAVMKVFWSWINRKPMEE